MESLPGLINHQDTVCGNDHQINSFVQSNFVPAAAAQQVPTADVAQEIPVTLANADDLWKDLQGEAHGGLEFDEEEIGLMDGCKRGTNTATHKGSKDGCM